ncbi:hypothetical protein C0993_009289, partial [Termitomyces sp. T159_Od127]
EKHRRRSYPSEFPIDNPESHHVPALQATDPTTKERSSVDIGPPTGNEYAGQAARGFFQVLEAISEAVPIPAFGVAVKVAANIVQACDNAAVTLERAEDLKVRVKTLVAVFVNELKGMKEEDIQDKLIQDIDKLNKFVENHSLDFVCLELRC